MAEIKIRKSITQTSSIFLDGIRIVAALTVFFSHSMDRWFPSSIHNPETANSMAHAAVIVFFVLSGYVIAYTTYSKNTDFKSYLIARFSRLGSILYPTLIITSIILIYLKLYDTDLYFTSSRGSDIVRIFLAGGFLNELWMLSAAPPINRPLWSLSFEFWYYMIFGVWYFTTKNWLGYLLVIMICLIAGPKILVMMPIWIFGCLAYLIPARKVSDKVAWMLITILFLLALLVLYTFPPLPWGIGSPPMYFANQFITDWLVGALIALALWFIPVGENVHSEPSQYVFLIRKMGDLTFPLYVLHIPLLTLYRSLVGIKVNDLGDMSIAITVVLSGSVIIGLMLEYHRRKWTKLFQTLFNLKFVK